MSTLIDHTADAAGLLNHGVSGSRLGTTLRLSRHGAHLFDRRSGLNVLLDEAAIPPERWHRAPRYVSVAVTNACELSCPYCYAPKQAARLAVDQIVGWAGELSDAGCLGLGLGGGEPTAHPDFARLCCQLADQTGMAVTFTTHGHRLDEPMASRIRGSVHFIRVSVDGTGDIYQRLRGRSFERLLEQLALVASIAPFGINVVVNDETVGQLDELAERAAAAGACEMLLLPEQPARGRTGISAATKVRLADWIGRGSQPLRLAISKLGVQDGMPLADPFGDEGPLEAHAHIDAAGWLRPDAFSVDGVLVGASVMSAVDELAGRLS
jgi:MoaA/NifB/PqqE/SkfB family radical SAM enzyme